ncbi:hypothetical protein I552_5386 [Mycobacterium xenopi 3993]|nr:hypothetical protein I552_5386 [Mycobacterium xenopi 3993]
MRTDSGAIETPSTTSIAPPKSLGSSRSDRRRTPRAGRDLHHLRPSRARRYTG